MKRNEILSLVALFFGALTMASELSSPRINETETITVHFSGPDAERLYNHLNVREVNGPGFETQSTKIKRAENVICRKVTNYGHFAPNRTLVTVHCQAVFNSSGEAELAPPL